MDQTNQPGYIRCSFYPELKKTSRKTSLNTDIYIIRADRLISDLSSMSKQYNNDDIVKAERSQNNDTRKTSLTGYTLLRMELARRLNKDPNEIRYTYSSGGKPGLENENLHFSISHTKDSFVFALSEIPEIGIDLEELNKVVYFEGVVKRFFSQAEYDFIFKSAKSSRDRFFLLWTRKEALLKSIGTGIVPQLSLIEVCKRVNHIDRRLIEDFKNVHLKNDYFIYSMKFNSYYLSISLPVKSGLNLNFIDDTTLTEYFNKLQS